ncbi:MAG: hypothetical protein KGS61_13545 [Verrucomicrobia bacterium]|nr:hypothetical protein [Verrucomicrobiota bacterium]
MRRLDIILGLLLCAGCVWTVGAAEARIIKVLPHYLDQQGRRALSPSLYERDAYQAQLRRHPQMQSTMRFDVQWKARGSFQEPLRLRLELRTSRGDLAKPYQQEETVRPGRWFSRWSALTLKPALYRQIGEVLAWRVTLWEGNRQLAEQKSFLW